MFFKLLGDLFKDIKLRCGCRPIEFFAVLQGIIYNPAEIDPSDEA